MKRIFFTVLVFIILSAGGLAAAVMCYQESYITTLLQYHDNGVYASYSSEPIAGNNVIRTTVMATHNNLATIKLRINTFNRMNTTHIVFRLKEKGNNVWIAVNTYTVDRFTGGLLYPFGFAPIPDSKGKVYEFEVSSSDGTADNAIGIIGGYHCVATQYVFSKSDLLKNRGLLTMFVIEKIKNTLGDSYSLLYLGMFGIPALSWVIGRIGAGKKLPRYVYAICMLYLILVYTYLPVDMHSNTILCIAVFGSFIGYLSRARAPLIYILALLCLVEIPFLILFGNTMSAGRSATLIFFLMIAGGIMSI